MTTKRCSCCTADKALTEFHKRAKSLDGLQDKCKPCARIYAGDHASRYTERARFRKYGMTPGDYEVMFVAQEGRCACCGRLPNKLVVDHDHRTGAVRELLCHKCNTMVGYFETGYAPLVEQYVTRHLAK